ncbi:hypothetical protein HAX54_002042, partial [Datura stramonium]|nr:hypothetical protein [Datura stramonium]
RSFNEFLGIPVEDPKMYFQFLEKPPYRDIRHTLCGEHSIARWTRSETGVHSILPFSYLTKRPEYG